MFTPTRKSMVDITFINYDFIVEIEVILERKLLEDVVLAQGRQ